MKKLHVINTLTSPKYSWGENCESFVLLNTKSLSVKNEIMPHGTEEKLHYHNDAQQFFYILKGVATFYMEGETVTVNVSEGIHVKAKQKHYISNLSLNPLEFLVISEPSTNEDRITLK